jgi:hypothetical protein
MKDWIVPIAWVEWGDGRQTIRSREGGSHLQFSPVVLLATRSLAGAARE